MCVLINHKVQALFGFAVTGEQASVMLTGESSRHVRPLALQNQLGWPAPRQAVWPHVEPWAEFLRPLAPGLYSSSTWVHPDDVSKAKCIAQALLLRSDSCIF